MLRLPVVPPLFLTVRPTLAPTLALMLAGVLLQLPAAHAAAEEPDVTPPQIDTSPTWCGDPCQREVFEFWGDLAEGDDLASIEVLLDGVSVDARIYDDGTGFAPYGSYLPKWQDYIDDVDYAVQVPVPAGDHEVRVILRDPAGNTREDVHAIRGAEAPGAVPELQAVVTRGVARVTFGEPDPHGGFVTVYRFMVDGRRVQTARVGPLVPRPEFEVSLAPGRHRLAVRAVNSAGVGERAVVRVRVHRR